MRYSLLLLSFLLFLSHTGCSDSDHDPDQESGQAGINGQVGLEVSASSFTPEVGETVTLYATYSLPEGSEFLWCRWYVPGTRGDATEITDDTVVFTAEGYYTLFYRLVWREGDDVLSSRPVYLRFEVDVPPPRSFG